MQNAGLDEAQAGIKIAGRNSSNLRYDTTLIEESEEELKSFLMKVKEENEKSGLKLNIQKMNGIWLHHFMANRWGNNGNNDRFYFIFLGSKSLKMVTATMKLSCLLLGRKAMTNLDSILKSRDITLSTKVRLVKAVAFPVWM